MKDLIVTTVLLSMAGCSSLPLESGAERVRITHNEPLQTECQFLGDVTGSQEGLFTSSAKLETGARNDLKNKALKLGGNIVYLLTQRAGESWMLDSDVGGSSSQINVVLSGNVYYCPSV